MRIIDDDQRIKDLLWAFDNFYFEKAYHKNGYIYVNDCGCFPIWYDGTYKIDSIHRRPGGVAHTVRRVSPHQTQTYFSLNVFRMEHINDGILFNGDQFISIEKALSRSPHIFATRWLNYVNHKFIV